MKLDLLTNAAVVGDGIKFVSEYPYNNNKLISKEDSQGSKEDDYDEDKDQVERDSKRKLRG
jgi:hypothetical protein